MNDQSLNFDQQVLERSRQLPVLVDFWAEWCGPCQSLGPVLEKLAAEAVDQWALVKIDVDANQQIAARFQVRSIPAVMLFDGGEMVATFNGALPESEIRSWLANHLPTPSVRQLSTIKALLQNGEFKTAIPLLEELVLAEPEWLTPRIYLAERIMFADPSRAAELVEQARLGDDLFDQVEAVRHIARLLQRDPSTFAESPVREDYLNALTALHNGEVETALGSFIKTLIPAPDYDNQGARKSCIAIFNWLGEGDRRVRDYRRKMQQALN